MHLSKPHLYLTSHIHTYVSSCFPALGNCSRSHHQWKFISLYEFSLNGDIFCRFYRISTKTKKDQRSWDLIPLGAIFCHWIFFSWFCGIYRIYRIYLNFGKTQLIHDDKCQTPLISHTCHTYIIPISNPHACCSIITHLSYPFHTPLVVIYLCYNRVTPYTYLTCPFPTCVACLLFMHTLCTPYAHMNQPSSCFLKNRKFPSFISSVKFIEIYYEEEDTLVALLATIAKWNFNWSQWGVSQLWWL